MSLSDDHTGATTAPAEWTHHTVISQEQPRATARAFVCPHLLQHGLSQLVDIIQLVACELAGDAAVRANPPATMRLSKTGDVVRLEVQDYPPGGAAPPAHADYRSRFIELLSLQWGMSTEGETTSVWVTFDARPHRHQRHADRRITDFARGQVPGVPAHEATVPPPPARRSAQDRSA